MYVDLVIEVNDTHFLSLKRKKVKNACWAELENWGNGYILVAGALFVAQVLY